MIEDRLKAAVKKLQDRQDGIPLDEQVGDNPDFAKLVTLITTLKNYQAMLEKINEKLTQFGV